MKIEDRFETGGTITEEKIHPTGSGDSLMSQLSLVESCEVKRIDGQENSSREDVVVDPCLDHTQQERLRKTTGGIVLQTLNKRQLTKSHFNRITRLDQTYWKKWLGFQLKNDRLVLKDEVYLPGPQWVITLVSMPGKPDKA